MYVVRVEADLLIGDFGFISDVNDLKAFKVRRFVVIDRKHALQTTNQN